MGDGGGGVGEKDLKDKGRAHSSRGDTVSGLQLGCNCLQQSGCVFLNEEFVNN